MKKLVHSKTFWLAVAQAVAGVIMVAFTELDMVGYASMVKSLVDVILRLATTEPVDRIV